MADVNMSNQGELIQALKIIQSLRQNIVNLTVGLFDKSDEGKDGRMKRLSTVKMGIESVSKQLGELHKIAASLFVPQTTAVTGNVLLIGLDSGLDQSHDFSNLLSTRRWSSQIHDIAQYGCQILSQQVRRGGNPAKRRIIQKHLSSTNPQYMTAVQITVPNVFHCFLMFRSYLLESVNIRAISEDLKRNENNEITDHATLHLPTIQSQQTMNLVYTLRWLRSYRNLFSAACSRCKRCLLDNLPPTWRDIRSLEAMHDTCRH